MGDSEKHVLGYLLAIFSLVVSPRGRGIPFLRSDILSRLSIVDTMVAILRRA